MVDTSDWSKALVEIEDGYIIQDRVLDSEEEMKDFCERHGYKLLKFTKGTNRLCK